MDEDRSVALQLAELTRRIEALEAGRTSPDSPGAGDAGRFWVLEGLKQRTESGVVYAGAVETAAGPVEWQIGLGFEQLMDRDWGQAAASLAALGNRSRLGILQAVLAGANAVADLSSAEGMGTTGQLYHHLNQLVAHGWLHASGRGHYGIPAERVVPLLVILAATRGAS